jgi:hypothetical protein
MITEEIVDEVTRLGRFLRYDKDHEQWLVMDRENARIKVSQALQYRHRRVAKGLENMDDSLEPNPLPPSHQGGQAGQQHISQRTIPEPATSSLVVHSRDVRGLSQGSAGSQQHQQQLGGWGAINRHQQQQQQQQQRCVLPQPNLPSQQQQQQQLLHQQQQQPLPSFDYSDDTSIGFAAVQQQQRDRQTLSHQFEDILSRQQGRMQNLTSTSTGQLHFGPLYNVAAARQESYAAGLGHLGVADQHPQAGILHAAAASQERQSLMALALALEPRPLPFRSANDVMATGVPNSFGTSSSSSTHTTSTAAARGIDDISFRPIPTTTSLLASQQGQHRQPPQQGQHNRQTTLYQTQPSAALAQHEDVDDDDDDDDAASLADLLTEDVEDDPPVEGKEPESDWEGDS